MISTQRALPEALLCAPTVFAVGRDYQIFVPMTCEAVVWVRVGEETYFDDANGILRSGKKIHKLTLPMAVLDEAKSYTLCYRQLIERKPYFPTSYEPVELVFAFHPLPTDRPLSIYHISDTHNLEAPVLSAMARFEDAPDLLILNGDIPNHSGKIEYFDTIYRLSAAITGGEIPVIFARGNHDTRGIYGEVFGEYTPTRNGRTYYTVRLGPVWCLVLDCGEDKPDDHAEYGHTVAFHAFRQAETRWLRQVAQKQEYSAKDIQYRLLICHVPFTHILEAPFDIEQELYGEWARLMREEIRPHLSLHGHLHKTTVWMPGHQDDHLGQACPVLLGGKPIRPKEKEPHYVGMALRLDGTDAHVSFRDDEGKIEGEVSLVRKEDRYV